MNPDLEKRVPREILAELVSGATSKAASDSVVISSELDSFQSLVKPSVERLYGLKAFQPGPCLGAISRRNGRSICVGENSLPGAPPSQCCRPSPQDVGSKLLKGSLRVVRQTRPAISRAIPHTPARRSSARCR